MSNITNSSYSDDGKRLLKMLTLIGRRSEDKVGSLQVEFSDRGKATNYYYYNGRISEEEIESERERRSTPPGTIGESQDVMSENIGSSFNMLGRKHGVISSFQYHPPKSLGMAFDRKESMGIRNLPPGFAAIKERIQLPNDSKQLITFKKIYDKLFREFKEKLVSEYA